MGLNLGLRQGLDVVATIAILAACGIVSWKALTRADGPKVGVPPIYQVGDLVDPIDGVDLGSSGPTLLVHVASTCRFCTQSMSFYKRLASRPRNTRFVVVGVESRDALEAYAKKEGLTPDLIVSVRPGKLKLPVTPVLVLVGPDGRVQKLWRGLLNEAQQNEVLRLLE